MFSNIFHFIECRSSKGHLLTAIKRFFVNAFCALLPIALQLPLPNAPNLQRFFFTVVSSNQYTLIFFNVFWTNFQAQRNTFHPHIGQISSRDFVQNHQSLHGMFSSVCLSAHMLYPIHLLYAGQSAISIT